MPKLRIKYGDDWKEVSIQSHIFRIGRAGDNDYVIDSGFISRHHCQLIQEDQVFFLEDLGSKIGTKLNGKTMTRKAIRFGDTIQLGKKFEAEFLEDKNVLNTATLRAQKRDLQVDTERLVALDGPLANEVFNLDKNLIRIGRHIENDICLPLDTISKFHAELIREARGLTLIDLQSGNGTYVGNHRVGRQKLRSGDIIRFDWVSFRFEDTHFRLGKSGTRIRSAPDLPHLASTDGDNLGLLGSYRHPLGGEEETTGSIVQQPKPKRSSFWAAMITAILILMVMGSLLFAAGFVVMRTDLLQRWGIQLPAGFFQIRDISEPTPPVADANFELMDLHVHPRTPTRGQILQISADFEVLRENIEITTRAQLFFDGVALLQNPPIQQRRWPMGHQVNEFAIQIPMLAEPGSYQVMISFAGGETETSRLLAIDVLP